MTREEAIKILSYRDADGVPCGYAGGITEALEIAIKALEQESSGDLISRQAVLDACEQSINILEAVDRIMDLPSVKQEPCSNCCNGNQIEKAKLCQKSYLAGMEHKQEPKTGHWITQWNAAHQKEYYYCSECREEFSYDGETGIKMNDYRYCPNCGCRMVEPQESEE